MEVPGPEGAWDVKRTGQVVRRTTYSGAAPWRKHGTWRVEKPRPWFDGRKVGPSGFRPVTVRKAGVPFEAVHK